MSPSRRPAPERPIEERPTEERPTEEPRATRSLRAMVVDSIGLDSTKASVWHRFERRDYQKDSSLGHAPEDVVVATKSRRYLHHRDDLGTTHRSHARHLRRGRGFRRPNGRLLGKLVSNRRLVVGATDA